MAAPVIPVGVSMATIAWLWTAAIGDETTVPTGLTVTFDPAPEWLQYTAATPHMTIAPWSVTATIGPDGTLLGPDGTANVTLLPTDDTDLNPSAWTYQVTVRQGSLVLMDFPIAAPGGVTTDLATVTPIAGSTGNAVVTGPPGADGPPGSPTAFELRGTGFPEGVVTASLGTYYTDTAGTNGAWRWLKTSGTGATGWIVVAGDTGVRLVTSTELIDGSVMLWRRINNDVTITIGRGSFDSFRFISATPNDLGNVATGFYPVSSSYIQILDNTSNTIAGIIVITPVTNSGYIRLLKLSVPIENFLYPASAAKYTTADPWPPTLPGTPG